MRYYKIVFHITCWHQVIKNQEVKIKRLKAGIIFLPNEWMGGTYYILNLIAALNFLPEEQRPEVYLFTSKKEHFNQVKSEINYTQLRYVRIPSEKRNTLIRRIVRKMGWMLLKRDVTTKQCKIKLDILYPYSYHPFITNMKNKVYWIPDLQDKYYPEFFSINECNARESQRKELLRNNEHIVFSSGNAMKDFEKFYGRLNHGHVMHFAAASGVNQWPAKNELREKYSLNNSFFYSPNQFWKHKNHEVVIEAVRLLKQKGVPVQVAFSGREEDPRHADYTKGLKEMVRSYGLDNEVRFLGFIDREDVYGLMKHAVAVIQPSLFEGWSTVIEDALLVGAPVIASDLEVNREQASGMASFFKPGNPGELATLIEKYIRTPETYELDYKNRIHSFARSFMQLAAQIQTQP
jgi:glycosyltransferase involved in cell wall biosynthesis